MDARVSLVNPRWILFAILATVVAAPAQLRLDFRPVGNTQIIHATGDVAGGPVSRVWFADRVLFAKLHSGRTMQFSETAGWTAVEEAAAPVQATDARRFRADRDVFRSGDDGRSWVNLTSYRGESILGGSMNDVAVSPQNPDEVVAAGETGVWRSMDGGRTWAGLNDRLPNLPVRRILRLPGDGRGLQVETEREILEWTPGQRLGWLRISGTVANPGVAVAASGDVNYLGFADGKILTSRAGGVQEPVSVADFPIGALWADPSDSSTAIALAGSRIYRTFNGGVFWDDITGSLDGGRLHGVTADRAARSIYVATDRGVAYGRFDFAGLGQSYGWQWLEGSALPKEPVRDVRLDKNANQLFIAYETSGIFASMAPHRRERPAIASAADGSAGVASPGALLRLVGRAAANAESAGRNVPILAAMDDETQVQVPFDVEGAVLPLVFGAAGLRFDVPLQTVNPRVFEDRDGSPIVLDADSGVALDAMNPARPLMRVQVLAGGLGKVRPDWPAGVPAPIDDPPAVVAGVRAVLDGQPMDVTRATLAPGYAGFYLVEFEMPAFVNAGTAELYLEASGRPSNRVRVYIEP